MEDIRRGAPASRESRIANPNTIPTPRPMETRMTTNGQHAIDLQAQIPVEVSRGVLLHDELAARAGR